MLYAMPGSDDALFTFKDRYENFIGGERGPASAVDKGCITDHQVVHLMSLRSVSGRKTIPPQVAICTRAGSVFPALTAEQVAGAVYCTCATPQAQLRRRRRLL